VTRSRSAIPVPGLIALLAIGVVVVLAVVFLPKLLGGSPDLLDTLPTVALVDGERTGLVLSEIKLSESPSLSSSLAEFTSVAGGDASRVRIGFSCRSDGYETPTTDCYDKAEDSTVGHIEAAGIRVQGASPERMRQAFLDLEARSTSATCTYEPSTLSTPGKLVETVRCGDYPYGITYVYGDTLYFFSASADEAEVSFLLQQVPPGGHIP
jgi:hypothetical protein